MRFGSNTGRIFNHHLPKAHSNPKVPSSRWTTHGRGKNLNRPRGPPLKPFTAGLPQVVLLEHSARGSKAGDRNKARPALSMQSRNKFVPEKWTTLSKSVKWCVMVVRGGVLWLKASRERRGKRNRGSLVVHRRTYIYCHRVLRQPLKLVRGASWRFWGVVATFSDA